MVSPGNLRWYPWVGTRELLTLHFYALHANQVALLDFLSLGFNLSIEGFTQWLESVVASETPAETLAAIMEVKEFDRFDRLLKDSVAKDHYLLD